MHSARVLLGTLIAFALAVPAAAREPDPRGLGQALVNRLGARRASDLAATDFSSGNLGCIVLPQREVRPHGFPGHAFLCEDGSTGNVLGALLSKKGIRRCTILGAYAGDFCYDITICDTPEHLCVVR